MSKELSGNKLRPLISEHEISKRVKELAKEITRDYSGESLVLIGVLKGGFVFLADLLREIELRTEVDFIRVTSYGNGTQAEDVNLLSSISVPINNRHVLVVEDLADTGGTLKFISEMITSQGPASYKTCALIDKVERRKTQVRIDYTGFLITEGFVVGYGMDYAEMGRYLPGIYVVEQ